MNVDLFEDMKRYIRFGPAEARVLAELGPRLRPSFPSIVDTFYERLVRHAPAREVLERSGVGIDHLKETFLGWLRELFCGRYDEQYMLRRARIGRAHVRVGLPQQYMFTGMTVFRMALVKQIDALELPNSFEARSAVNKLLDLELAIMNDTYREDLVARVEDLERIKYEARLSESEHLATIGQLAATLAHEIKNPLAGISGAIQVLAADLSDDHPHKEVTREVMRQIDRLDAAVKDLLVYARPKPPAKTVQNLSNVMERALMLFREHPGCRSVRVRTQGLEAAVETPVDDAQMHQVLTNLLLNAAHACAPKGEIWCRLEPMRDGARIQIEDNGTGIRPDLLEKVFEPFFTTKSRGTGLGLPICKRIVETHGGTIRLDSELGRGTRVTIELPGC